MKVAVIPARGGSKRIPRKNIRPFYGKPMIAWSIEAAQKSGVFDKIIVSTDDAEIAEVAIQWGADVPFLRPDELSDDYTGTTAVIAHATRQMQSQVGSIEAVCCIYATAPFIDPADLKKGLQELQTDSWEYTFTATEYRASVYRAFQQTASGGLEMLFPEHFSTRSQDLPATLHDAGQFYWGRPDAWLNEKIVFSHHSKPIIIPGWRVQDIDTMEDWERAQIMAKGIFEHHVY